MRTFVAVELPPEVRARIHAAAAELLCDVRAAKPVPEENLHVTVRFIGEAADAQIPPIEEALRGAAGDVAPSVAEARGFGAFPNARRPRIVWTGFDDPAGTFAELEAAISTRLAPLGHVREERPFVAHLTVARMKEHVREFGPLPTRLEAAAQRPPAFGPVSVAGVTLFRSELGRGGPRYTALARFPLMRP